MDFGLKERAIKGLIWAVGERFLTQGTLFVISIILARILSPTEYGTIAMLMVFINIADVLVTNGLGESLIQKSEIKEVDYSTIMICGFVLSALLYMAIFCAAPAIAMFYQDESITFLLRLLAIRIPLSSLNAIQKAHVAKNFLFRKQFVASFLGSFISGVTAIALAFEGLGVMALIAQQLLTVTLSSAALVATSRWFPKLSFSRTSFKELFPLGIQFSGASMINALYNEGRSLLIGKFYSPSDLALFNRGNQFPSLIISNLNAPVSNVILPVMSEVKNSPEKLKDVTRKAMQLTSFLTFPLMGYLIISAEPLVDVLLGEQWMGSVVYLQIACLFYLFQPLQTMNWQMLKASGKGALCFRLEVIKKLIGFALLFASIPFGVFWIAVSSALFGAVSMIVNMIPSAKIIDYPFFEQLKDLAGSFFVALVASLVGCVPLLFPFDSIVVLLLQALFGLAAYAMLARLFKLKGLCIVVQEAKRKRRESSK